MSKTDNKKGATLDANEDPLTGAPGAHPVGVAVGATGGAAAGAAVGGLAGGLAGKGAAEAINPTVEEAYWRDTYVERPYVETGRHYDYYRPAYRFGWESYSQYGHRDFDELEETLSREWDERRGDSKQTWNEAREAARDAWNRVSGRNTSDALPYGGRRHA